MGYVLLFSILSCSSVLAMDDNGTAAHHQSEGRNQLLERIKAADPEGVRASLLLGARPVARTVDYEKENAIRVNDFVTEALCIENAEKRFEILRHLLDVGADPNDSAYYVEQGEQKRMPLLSYLVRRHGATGATGDPEREVTLLIACGARVNERDFLQQPPLFHAIQMRCPQVIKILIAAGVSSVSSNGHELRGEMRAMIQDPARYREQHPEEVANIRARIAELSAEHAERQRIMSDPRH